MVSTKAVAELVTALSLTVASVIGFFIVSGYPGASKIMPVAIVTGTLILSIVWIGQIWLSGEFKVKSQSTMSKEVLLRLAIAFASLALMLLGVSTIGFFTTYVIVIPLTAWCLGYRNAKGIALGTVIFCAGLYFIFKTILNRPLPLEIWMLGA